MARRRSNQEGSFYQRPDGLWIGRVSVDGKRRQFTGGTRAEAAKKLQQFVREPYDGTNQSLAEFLAYWLTDICKPRLKPRTYSSYSDLVRLHINPELGHVKLAKLTPHIIQRWQNAKLASHLSARTVLHAHSVLRTALNRAVKLSHIPRNPVTLIDPPKVVAVEITPLTPEQVATLLAATQGQRFGPLYAVLASTGLRLGESLALRWSDVDLDQGLLHVRHSLLRMPREPWVLAEPKSARSKRTVPLIGRACTALQAQRDRQSFERSAAGSKYREHGFVFAQPDGEPLTSAMVDHAWKRDLKAAGLPLGFRVHDLRHGCATYLLASGVAETVVMSYLGHTNLSTTRGYMHVRDTMLSNAAAKLESFLAASVAV